MKNKPSRNVNQGVTSARIEGHLAFYYTTINVSQNTGASMKSVGIQNI